MNQQRQLIARRGGRLGKASGRRQPSLANVCGQQIYLAVLHVQHYLRCQPLSIDRPREFLHTIYVPWFTKLFTEVVVFVTSPSRFPSFLQGIISLTFSTSSAISRVVYYPDDEQKFRR